MAHSAGAKLTAIPQPNGVTVFFLCIVQFGMKVFQNHKFSKKL